MIAVARFLATVFVTIFASTSVHAVTLEEATTGAAAVVIVAQKCYPQYVDEAVARVNEMLDGFFSALLPGERAVAQDSARRKLRAMQISGGTYSCQDVEHLRNMARQWGFAHLILD